jgi:hypothetical protein
VITTSSPTFTAGGPAAARSSVMAVHSCDWGDLEW